MDKSNKKLELLGLICELVKGVIGIGMIITGIKAMFVELKEGGNRR